MNGPRRVRVLADALRPLLPGSGPLPPEVDPVIRLATVGMEALDADDAEHYADTLARGFDAMPEYEPVVHVRRKWEADLRGQIVKAIEAHCIQQQHAGPARRAYGGPVCGLCEQAADIARGVDRDGGGSGG